MLGRPIDSAKFSRYEIITESGGCSFDRSPGTFYARMGSCADVLMLGPA